MEDTSLFDCPICGEVFTRVVETPCCHKCFCKECLGSWILKSFNCPECREKISSLELCKPNLPIQRMIDNIPASCPNKESGCEDSITRGIIDEHRTKCSFESIICPNSAVCGMILRKDLSDHIKTLCSYRMVNCDLCGKELKLDIMKVHSEVECEEKVVSCDQNCGSEVKRKDLPNHTKTSCSEALIKCLYHRYGCQKQTKRKDSEEHARVDMESHLELTTKALEIMENENVLILKKVSSLQHEIEGYQSCIHFAKKSLPNSQLNGLPLLLPSYLVSIHETSLITLDQDDRSALYRKGSLFGISQLLRACLIRGDLPIPKNSQTYYFEMSIESSGKDGAIGIGLVLPQHISMVGMPGWEKGYGYHGDDGRKFGTGLSGEGQPYGPTYTKGDIIGLGFDMASGTIFFTKNGVNLGDAFTNVAGIYYPAIGLHTPDAKIRVNFGQEPFKYATLNSRVS